MPRTKATKSAGAHRVHKQLPSSKLPGLHTARLLLPEVVKTGHRKSHKPGTVRKPKVEISNNRWRVTITPATSAAILAAAADELEVEQQMQNVCNKAITEYIEAREREKEMSEMVEEMGLGEGKNNMDVDD
ncbi:hypothetical protein MMC10_007215 [Thelotrema lepadinum]|nr:hypothetical protein [Thelotrema lepadinum]